MIIRELEQVDRAEWNTFIVEHFPTVGAFLQSYEWGEFKDSLYGKGKRFVVTDDKGQWLACFHTEIHRLPGCVYGYAPRGPVVRKDIVNTPKSAEVFAAIAAYFAKSNLLFVRFEPAMGEPLDCFSQKPFSVPRYYVQPRFNQIITLMDEAELLASFSSDVRHDIRAATRLGITVTDTAHLTKEQDAQFTAMKHDTRARSHKGIFPTDFYFGKLLGAFGLEENTKDEDLQKTQPRVRYFIASNADGKPVAINMNILFGNTLTYLYGASYTGSISKRAPAYLHWKTMEYAREHGFTHYDLGGVDESMWHGLTYFKRQFGGETLAYMGNVDIVLHPFVYHLYNSFKEGH